MIPDADTCYRAVSSRDRRFDGWFFTAVHTTGIYCRPSCPAITPRRRNVAFYASAAAAQRAGFRACKRCRPDTAPGSPEWDVRGDLAGRALRLIADGVVDRDGVPGLAARLGYSERQLNRTLQAEVGAGPLALARAQRAQTARVLLETTELPVTQIAFAAGFSSVRQFNDTVRAVYASSPSGLRAGRRARLEPEPGTLVLRLALRPPVAADQLVAFLLAHRVPGVEWGEGTGFARTLRLPHGAATAAVEFRDDHACARLRLADVRDLTAAVARLRRLLDLDADPQNVDHTLSRLRALAPLVARRPGLRAPGTVDGFELAARTVVGQQVSVAGARRVLGRIVERLGDSTVDGRHLFPSAEALAGADPYDLPMPRSRGRALIALAAATHAGDLQLDVGADRESTERALRAIPGIGAWTARYVWMRALADPDVLLDTDLAIRRQLDRLALRPADTDACAPWRSYLSHHLWADYLDGPTTDPTAATTGTTTGEPR